MTHETKRYHLTPTRIEAFPKPDGKQATYYFDDNPKQLAVRVTPAGVKSYVYAGKLNRTPLRITIGSTDTWILDDARIEARRLQTLVDNGLDPRMEKAERIAATEAKRQKAKRHEQAALEVWADYIDARRHQWQELHLAAHLDAAKEGGEPRTRGRKGVVEPGILRPLLLLPLPQITPAVVQSWLKKEAARRPTRARGAFVLMRAFINWCADQAEYQDHVCADACTAKNTKQELPAKRAKKDVLLREQLPAWFEYVGKIHNPTIAAYFQGLLLTGARPGELVALKWDDIDLRWNSLTIRDKVEGERTIPLTPYFRLLILALPRRNDWVFAGSHSKTGHLAEPSAQHKKALTAAGLPNLSLHGLRRSFGSLSEYVECPAGVVAQIQGHKPSATAEKHYRVRPLDLLRMWHSKIEGWILDQAGIEQPTEDAQPLRVVA